LHPAISRCKLSITTRYLTDANILKTLHQYWIFLQKYIFTPNLKQENGMNFPSSGLCEVQRVVFLIDRKRKYMPLHCFLPCKPVLPDIAKHRTGMMEKFFAPIYFIFHFLYLLLRLQKETIKT
jgi:hypothetical protein